MRVAPQHIKKQCSTKVFREHLSGERGLELHLDNLPDLAPGDLITFLEVDEAGNKTGRTFSRKIVQVERTSDLEISAGDADRYGFVVIGLQAPEFNTFRLAFNNHFLLGVIVECTGEGWQINQAQCWPLLLAPANLARSGILQQLHLDKWPAGIYTLHLSVLYDYHSDKQQLELELDDSMILAFCENPTASGIIEGVELELNALVMMGKAIGAFDGLPWTPAGADYVREYYGHTADKNDPSLHLYSTELDETQIQEVLRQQPTRSSTEAPPWNNT
jgi:hypothetical protein